MEYLCVFECNAFMHVFCEDRIKFDAKVIECIFLGYADDAKVYRLFDLKARKVHVSQQPFPMPLHLLYSERSSACNGGAERVFVA